MYTPSQVALMQQTLITSVSCGDSKLEKILADNANTIWCMSSLGCYQEVQYLKAQLGMIELAQQFTRNMVDTSTRKGSSRAQDKFDSSNYRDNQSQRTGQGTNCSWSKATTFQQFQRDSEQHARSQSDSHADTIGKSSSYLWDRSQQVSNGWANSFDQSSSLSTSNSVGYSGDCIDRESESQGGTPSQPVVLDVAGQSDAPTLDFLSYGAWSVFSVISDWFSSSWWSGETIAAPDGNAIWSTTNEAFGSQFPLTGGTPDCPVTPDAECESIPTYGASYSDDWNISVGIPQVGSISANWKSGQDFNQSYTCHTGKSKIFGRGFENGHSEGNSLSESEGKTQAHDEGENVHDRHRSASAFRDSESHATAHATDTMRSHGETHNGSDSSAHAEAQSGNQMTAYGVSHSEGLGTAFSHSESQSEAKYWGQIFDSLNDMWKRIWDELRVLEDTLSASTGLKIGRMKANCTPCEVKHRTVMNRRSVPAIPARSGFVAMATMGGCK